MGTLLFLEITDAKDRKRKIVFDTGKDKQALLQNIKLLKKDLKDLDCIVLSHGHLDHTATTAEIVKASGGTKVYAHPHTFLPRHVVTKDGKKRRIGVPEGEGIAEIEKAGGKIILTTKPTEILPGLWTTGQIPRTTFENVMDLPKGNKLVININGKETDDKILDDQSLYTHVKDIGALRHNRLRPLRPHKHVTTYPENDRNQTDSRRNRRNPPHRPLRQIHTTNHHTTQPHRNEPDLTLPLHRLQSPNQTLGSIPKHLCPKLQRKNHRSRQRTRTPHNLILTYKNDRHENQL